jgi:hypothetical protein
MLFTDYYAENNCTAGQTPLRTEGGRSRRAGGPAKAGYHDRGGLGDRDEYLLTNHGFDEFYGSRYHLNAEEEPERPYWPKDKNDSYVRNFRRAASCTPSPTAGSKTAGR